ncbi:hypothetical protein GJAV_G00079990 [Gymnothorax javanicus]|nr:hypothetical protein GJAV_G00079990 [Gymnothorax javanicus]
MKTLTGIWKLKEGTVPTVFAWNTNSAGRRKPSRTSHAEAETCEEDIPEDDQASTSSTLETPLPHPDHDYAQRPLPLEEQLQEARKTIALQEEELVKLQNHRFCLERFQCGDRLIMFYTGFKDYMTLMAVFKAMQPTAENMVGWSQAKKLKQTDQDIIRKEFKEQSLPLTDQFFLFLCRLRQGFLVQDLATRFNVSQATVSRICITWTNFLYYMLIHSNLAFSRNSKLTHASIFQKYIPTYKSHLRLHRIACAKVQFKSAKF